MTIPLAEHLRNLVDACISPARCSLLLDLTLVFAWRKRCVWTGAVVSRRTCKENGGEHWEVCRECSPLLARLGMLSSACSSRSAAEVGLAVLVETSSKSVLQVLFVLHSLPFRLFVHTRGQSKYSFSRRTRVHA